MAQHEAVPTPCCSPSPVRHIKLYFSILASCMMLINFSQNPWPHLADRDFSCRSSSPPPSQPKATQGTARLGEVIPVLFRGNAVLLPLGPASYTAPPSSHSLGRSGPLSAEPHKSSSGSLGPLVLSQCSAGDGAASALDGTHTGASWYHRSSNPVLSYHLAFPTTVQEPWPAQKGAQPFRLQQYCREQANLAIVPAREVRDLSNAGSLLPGRICHCSTTQTYGRTHTLPAQPPAAV